MSAKAIIGFDSLSLPATVKWPSGNFDPGWLIYVYDWDTISLHGSRGEQLSSPIDLCTGYYPCSLLLKGESKGTLRVSGNASISCRSDLGCLKMSIESVFFICDDNPRSESLFTVHHSSLALVNSTFHGCGSNHETSMIEVQQNSEVIIQFCSFMCQAGDFSNSKISVGASSLIILHSTFDCQSGSSKSMISMFDSNATIYKGVFSCFKALNSSSVLESRGSKLKIMHSFFHSCGIEGKYSVLDFYQSTIAVHSSVFTCGEDVQVNSVLKASQSTLYIFDSSFSECKSVVDGGVIQVLSGTFVEIFSCKFINLHSNGFGGSIAVFGSKISIKYSTFVNCSAQTGGAIWATSLQALNGSILVFQTRLSIESTVFWNCSAGLSNDANPENISVLNPSAELFESCQFNNIANHGEGFGGAIAAFGSSVSVLISSTTFFMSASRDGGGSIWISAFEGCSRFLQPVDTTLMIRNSEFDQSWTEAFGGAILAVSGGYSWSGEVLGLIIQSSRFRKCRAGKDGGAIRLSGSLVFSRLEYVIFDACLSSASGGIVSSTNGSVFSLLSSLLLGGVSLGLGGGAIHASESWLSVYNTSIQASWAPNGGGGVLFWQGHTFPARGCPTGSKSVIMYCSASGSIFESSESMCSIGICVACEAGAYQDEIDSDECISCPPGTFADGQGHSFCVKCSAGRFSTISGAKSSGVCKLCEGGQYSDFSATSCLPCSKGTFSEAPISQSCARCDAGKYSSVLSASSSEMCFQCNPGKFSPLFGASSPEVCLFCEVGTYAESSGHSIRLPLPHSMCFAISVRGPFKNY